MCKSKEYIIALSKFAQYGASGQLQRHFDQGIAQVAREARIRGLRTSLPVPGSATAIKAPAAALDQTVSSPNSQSQLACKPLDSRPSAAILAWLQAGQEQMKRLDTDHEFQVQIRSRAF